MNWFLYTVGAVIFFTGLNLLQKIVASNTDKPRAAAFVFSAFAAVIALVIFFLTDASSFQLPQTISAWIILLIACLAYGLFERLRFVVAKLLDASVFAMIGNMSMLIAFIGAGIFYSEKITVAKCFGLVFVIASVLLVTYERKHHKISYKGVLLGILAASILGVAWVLDKKGTEYFNAATYSILVWTIPLLFIYLPSIPVKDMVAVTKNQLKNVAAMAFLNAVGYYLQLKALSIAEATRVIPIVQTSVLFTVIIGIFLLKEKQNIWQKITAGCIAIIGVYLLA